MAHRYTCECGAEVDSRSNHESYCPGAPVDRISALENQVQALREELAELRNQVSALVQRVV